MAPPEEVKLDNITSEGSTENEQTVANGNEGSSRFSEDDIDTEIEVTPDENSEEKLKRKKKKKSGDESEEAKKKRIEAEALGTADDDVDPPAYTWVDEEEKKKKKKKKKRNFKKQASTLLDEPLLLIGGILVCVILPFSIYACDVIISVNVIDREIYRSAVISPENNMTQLPSPEHLVGRKYHGKQTLLLTIQINSKPKVGGPRSRITRQVSDSEPSEVNVISEPSPTNLTTNSPGTEESQQLSATPPATAAITSSPEPTPLVSINTTGVATNATTDAIVKETNATMPTNITSKPSKPMNTTTKKPLKFRPRPGFRFTTLKTTTTEKPKNVTVDPELWMQQDGEFCKGLHYFYELHMNYSDEYGSDWFNDQAYTVYQKEQTLFFMFTILGFVFLLAGVALRCDVFLSDEWSSFILVNLFLYSISMAVSVSVFDQENASGGLRCATCRFTTYCKDIDPWNYKTHWPAEPDTVMWSMTILLSFILKLIDCFAIAIVTLKFVVDLTDDYWVTCLKVFGWLFVFPLLIFTPMLGVIRFSALPSVAPGKFVEATVVEVFFYIGAVFWGLILIALPIFCKMRMCAEPEEETQEEEEEYC